MSTDTHSGAALTGSLLGQNVIVFVFAIGQRVYLIDAECWGRVKNVMAGPAGREYQVAYFDDDKVRRLEWVGEDELARKP